ncbi:MAG: cytochrome C oxidase subunit IV family protein [Bacteriovoracaceae bacterium]|nr:cytochrome C oxidase subunit IV family protein [Bacteriovoracaceae bacterium]
MSDANHHHGHHEHKSHKKMYFIVFGALAVLTVLELLVPDMKWPYALHSSSLTALALIKAFLVAYFFMHLNEEQRWLKFIAIIPVAAVLYTAMVAVETLSR